MKVVTISIGVILVFLRESSATQFGPAFSTGPVGANSWIQEAVSTLITPLTPTPIIGDVALWTGMGTDKNDLIQGITENGPPNG